MKNVGLLTDFGSKDNFVGVMKAIILNINPHTNFVDITHDILAQDVFSAAFLMLNSYRFFPKDTVFLSVVDPGVGSARKALIIKTKNYIFIGPDNGILSLAAKEDGIEKIVAIENKKYFFKNVSSTFHGRDIFAPVCGWVLKNVNLKKFGPQVKTIKNLSIAQPKVSQDIISAEIIYIDRFGNLITNISLETFKKFATDANFCLQINNMEISEFFDYYSQSYSNRPFLTKGSFGYVEIAVKNSSASDYLRAFVGHKFKIIRNR